ncbi:type II toxin-antitoxin system Phd/YefM family antitoxin [Antarcticimicrobium luteum]|uniref:Antitoxin n=1 Tax=Antarcticimicrobium luteum TaxID=2547397 RepID=A0A4R5UTE4_9RHOB|nr:type II toxin-antitoxin system Phd/YefM family antitoxin [Antarcticimicrobium luteum]TDK42420.1 type II toxin-antitoxin system Phd/YefM family antitoxin [Antarcticimicrobium luteum]
MQHMAARDAKNSFGRLIDTARAEPVAIDKYGRTVVVVIAIEEYNRLTALQAPAKPDSMIGDGGK